MAPSLYLFFKTLSRMTFIISSIIPNPHSCLSAIISGKTWKKKHWATYVLSFSLTDYRCLHQRDGETIQKFMRNIDTAMKKAYPKGFKKENIIYTELSNDKVMLFNYTSSTTGFSKGVMLTGNNLAGNVTFGIRTGLLKKRRKSTFFPTLGPCLWLCFRFSDRNSRNPCHAVRQDTFSKNSDESLRRSEAQPDYHSPPGNRKDIQECHSATYQ